MELSYWIANPSGNTTALVKEGFPAKLRREAAALLMETGEIEQVGFLCAPHAAEAAGRLEMAGGEFCGNATLSSAVWSAKSLMLMSRDPVELKAECSSAEGPLRCSVWNIGGMDYGAVEMPLPNRIYERDFSMGGRTETFAVVEMPGITHLLWPADMSGEEERGMPGEEARAFALSGIRDWCAELGAEALGVLLCGPEFERITPLVFVPEAGTLVWEQGCGSGTAALGAYLAKEKFSSEGVSPQSSPLESVFLEQDVRQPGGTIHAHAEVRGGVLCSLQISEAVTFFEEKTLRI